MKMIKRLLSLSLFFAMSVSSLPPAWGDGGGDTCYDADSCASSATTSATSSTAAPATTAASGASPSGTAALPVPGDTGTGDGLGVQSQSYKDIHTACDAFTSITCAGSVSSACANYFTSADKCNTAHRNAGYACLGGLNTSITTGIAVINGLLSAVSAVSVASSCSTFGKAMQVGRDALSAYSLACGGAQAICDSSCSTAVTNLKALSAAITKDTAACQADIAKNQALPDGAGAAMVAADQIDVTHLGALKTPVGAESSPTPNTTVTGKEAMCSGKYAGLLASGAGGIVSFIASAMEGNSCDTSSSTTDLSVLCTEAAYENTTQCLCYKNPLTQGCPNATTASGSSTFGATSTTAGTTGTGAGLVVGSDGGSGVTPGSAGAADAGGAPPPSGGGSGLDGGSADPGGAGGAGAAGAAGSKTNPNILGGVSGGGSGGGGFNGGAAEKLQAYLPGAAKDPNAAGTAASSQVTAPGGKSNWEKVRDRYTDDRSTLLNK